MPEYKRFGDSIVKRDDHTNQWVEVTGDEAYEAEIEIRVEERQRDINSKLKPGVGIRRIPAEE